MIKSSSKIPALPGEKSHPYVSEKVGRYTLPLQWQEMKSEIQVCSFLCFRALEYFIDLGLAHPQCFNPKKYRHIK